MQKLSPVDALSLDTLAPIFEFAVEAGQVAAETTKTPLALSQVCRAWRQSALKHAPLWTNILLGVHSDRSLERATEFLGRSRTLPICVTFDMQGARKEPTGLRERVSFLASHVHRLRALRIQGATTAPPIHQFLRDLDFPFTDLKDFEIVWGTPTARPPRRFPVLFGNEIPKSLLPYCFDFSPHDKFTNLTRFALKTHDHRLEIKLDQLLEILGGSPTLQYLEIEGFYFEYEDEEFYDPDEDEETEKSILQLPQLRFLSLKQCPSGVFLPRINVPATTNVVLIANDPFMSDSEFHEEPPNINYALPPSFDKFSFMGKFQTIDFEIVDSSITLRASQPNGQYLFIEQVPDPDPDAIFNTTMEEMILPSATGFALSGFGPVTTLRANNQLSKSKRGVLRDAESGDLVSWLSNMSHLEKLEVSYFPLSFFQSFSGDEGERRPPMAAKDVTLTLYPDECGDFEELKAWIRARAQAQLPFEKLEVALDYSESATPTVDEKFVESLRCSLAEYVKDVVVKVLRSP